MAKRMVQTIKRKQKRYFLPAIMSIFVAGFGQIIKGQSKKGLKIMLWFYFGLPIILLLSMIINAYLFLLISAIIVLIYPIIWIFNILDALTYQLKN